MLLNNEAETRNVHPGLLHWLGVYGQQDVARMQSGTSQPWIALHFIQATAGVYHTYSSLQNLGKRTE